jgi:DNA-binding MarR family transcriptional regulator
MRGDSPSLSGNEQVVIPLTGRDIDDLQRLLSLLAEASIQAVSHASSGTIRAHADLVAQAKLILASRKRRLRHFGKGVFGEPAWEMLLLLYITVSGQRQTVARLSELSGASRSTAIRWIEYLEREKLVSREPHPTDKRTDFVQLTDKGKQKLEAYLSETLGKSS